VFIGPFVDDPQHYANAPMLAGVSHFFVAPKSVCDACAIQADAGGRVYNTTAITPMLLDYVKRGALPSIHPTHVEPFLRKNLRWRVLRTQADEDLGKIDPADTRVTVHVNTNASFVSPGSFVPEEIDFVELDEEIVRQIENVSVPGPVEVGDGS
jgi:tyrosinase